MGQYEGHEIKSRIGLDEAKESRLLCWKNHLI